MDPEQPEAVLGPALAATAIIHARGGGFLQGNGLEEQEGCSVYDPVAFQNPSSTLSSAM